MKYYGTVATTPIRYDHRAEEKILSYSQYPKGWCYGRGIPPSDKVVRQAIELLRTAQIYSYSSDSTISDEGEIQLIIYRDHDILLFSITENNGIVFEHERKSDLSKPFLPENETEEICYEEGVTFDDAITIINNFGRTICSAHTSTLLKPYGQYQVLMEEGSAATHSKIHQTGQVSHVSLLVA